MTDLNHYHHLERLKVRTSNTTIRSRFCPMLILDYFDLHVHWFARSGCYPLYIWSDWHLWTQVFQSCSTASIPISVTLCFRTIPSWRLIDLVQTLLTNPEGKIWRFYITFHVSIPSSHPSFLSPSLNTPIEGSPEDMAETCLLPSQLDILGTEYAVLTLAFQSLVYGK